MEMKDFSLEGKVAWVTGASYGIGFAIATAFHKAGAAIAFNDINQELVDKGLASYKEIGIDAKGYVCDVTDEAQVQATTEKIINDLGKIDILVNNAGIIKRIPMVEMSAADFRKVIDIDLNGPFIVSKAVIPGMIKQGHGKIINICSMMSELGRETVSAYAAAKGGLKMLTRNIASEYGMVLDLDTSRHRRQLLSEFLEIRSMSLSLQRHLHIDGERHLIFRDQQYSLLQMLPTL